MQRAQIAALVQAHRGRVRPVAFLHVLRQERLEAADHEFLSANAGELALPDLLRWRSRTERGLTAHVIRELARRAELDPVAFRCEVLAAPRLDLEPEEWAELAELLAGKVPLPFLDEMNRLRAKPRCVRTTGVMAVPRDASDTLGLDQELEELFAEPRPTGGSDEQAVTHALGRPRDRLTALGWLERRETPRAQLIELALASIREAGTDLGIIAWLGRHLATRAAWEKHGAVVLDTLLDRSAFADVSDLLAVSVSEAQRNGVAAGRGFLDAIQLALGAKLVRMARIAIETRSDASALAALSALVCLDPPARLSAAVHELERLEPVDGAVAELIAVNGRMVRRGNGRAPSLEGLVAALHALADTA